MKVLHFIIIVLFSSTFVFATEEDPENDSGVWVTWSTYKDHIPLYAVYAGYDQNGPLFVIRSSHWDNHEYRGKFVGKYSPYLKKAYISFGTKEITKTEFEVLTHKSYAWVDASIDTYPLIPSIDRQYICRMVVSGYLMNGRFDQDSNTCYVSYGWTVHESKICQTLRRAVKV